MEKAVLEGIEAGLDAARAPGIMPKTLKQHGVKPLPGTVLKKLAAAAMHRFELSSRLGRRTVSFRPGEKLYWNRI
ncbi:MAG: hypothetical protein CM1200mP28_05320 [Deltaproteobacteria bacterium]|nr:MAG: hypothetical protein CM1200mP28_05320 [Deltaproteobacteria bacterium]